MDTEPKENSDLLKSRNNPDTNRNLSIDEHKAPPEGGLRAYFIVLASFCTNGLVFGVINSYSVIYTVLEKNLHNDGHANSASAAALVGSLAMGMTFAMSPFAGALTSILGLRLTAILGGGIATAGMLISSFVVNNVNVLYFTYGITYGIGASLAYTPSLAILGHYFKKRLGMINGIVTVGSSIFTVIMPPVMELVIKSCGLEWLFRLLALLNFGLVICGLSIKPLVAKQSVANQSCKSVMKTAINLKICKIIQYRLWAMCMPIALCGYFVPYVHIKKFINANPYFVDVNDNLPLQCIAFTSAVGRFTFGVLADKPGIDRILLQQISFYIIGTLTICMPFVKAFWLLVIISLGMGLFDGAFIALMGPIAIELCGMANGAQAIGCMLGCAAAPLSIGPPLAGHLYTIYQSYTVPYILAGLSPIIGATLMWLIRFQRRSSNRQATNTNGAGATPGSTPTDKSTGPLLKNGTANPKAKPV